MSEKTKPSAKIGMVSLGCPKNTVDTELVLGDLAQHGFEMTTQQEEADIIVVNTCGFIEASKTESINAILDMARLKTEGKCKKLVVTGCLSERYSEVLLEEIPEIDLMLGVNQYPRLKNLLDDDSPKDAAGQKDHVQDPPEYYATYGQRALTTPFYSAYLKLGEGCSFSCAFCSIPAIRGSFRSRPLDSVVDETLQLAASGVREFNLVSQVTTLYGADLKVKNGLIQLLRALVKIPGADWFRLLYCYPSFIDSPLVDCIAGEEKICNYIDVPLQHIDETMLKKMKRPESESDIRNMLEMVRRRIPDIALRTTFISGFPGETDAQFRKLLDFIREVRFDHVGVFEYSDEEGTSAFDYEDKVPREIATERKNLLMEAQKDVSLKNNKNLIGKTYPVLVEGFDEESCLMTGRTPLQAPEIDGQVIIEESDVEPGQIIPMRITRALVYDLIARANDNC